MSESRGEIGRLYLYIDQLAELTPWTEDAIRTMMTRGKLKKGVHYFQDGPRCRLIFKWRSVVQLIEDGVAETIEGETIPLANGKVIRLDEAARKIHRLLDTAA